jgi:hypothetical protein
VRLRGVGRREGVAMGRVVRPRTEARLLKLERESRLLSTSLESRPGRRIARTAHRLVREATRRRLDDRAGDIALAVSADRSSWPRQERRLKRHRWSESIPSGIPSSCRRGIETGDGRGRAKSRDGRRGLDDGGGKEADDGRRGGSGRIRSRDGRQVVLKRDDGALRRLDARTARLRVLLWCFERVAR